MIRYVFSDCSIPLVQTATCISLSFFSLSVLKQDGGGEISIEELRDVMVSFQTAGADIDDEYIDSIIAHVDADGDGTVSFHEFCEVMAPGVHSSWDFFS